MATNNSTNAGSVRSAPPGLDIFKTPENTTLYSANLYQSLDISNKEIRLIEMTTQTGDECILECRLLPATLLTDARKQYLALSYCAGDPTDTKEILVNGVRCNIFANLHHALVLARQYWMQSSGQGPLRLWVDQLCINQHDLDERSHQVGFMRDIYQSAERTLACLSTSTNTGEGLKWFNDLCDAVPSKEDDKSLVYDRDEDELGTDSDKLFRKIDPERVDAGRLGRLQWFRIRDHLWNNMHIEKFAKGWIAFYDVLSSPWWNRAWICQEFLVSGRVTFMFGNYFLSWEECWKTMQAFCGTHRTTLLDRSNFLQFQNHSIEGPGDRQLCRILDVVRKRDLNRQIDHVGMALRMKIQWNRSMDIKALLSHMRFCKSSDDRDRVYAILGLASPGYQILPDYSHNVNAAQVMIMATKAIIDKEDSLYILVQATTLVRSKNLDVPSWVVDWSSTEALDIRNSHFGKMPFHRLSGIPQESPEHTFETITDTLRQTQAQVLKVSGTFITKIALWAREWPYAWFLGSQEWQGSALISSTDGDEVWILYGLEVPIVLRPYRDGYQAVSCASIIGPDGKGSWTPSISAEERRARRSSIILY